MSRLSNIAIQFVEGRMRNGQVQGLFQEGFAGFDAMPGRRAGGVGQGNQVELVSDVGDAEGLADDGIQLLQRHELFDGEFADGQDKLRLEDFDLTMQPGGAIADFVGRRDTVAAGGFLSWKTATDGGHVDGGTENLFRHAGGFVKPAEQGFAGGPGKGTTEERFLVAGGLADEDDFAEHGAAADDGSVHLRAEAAGAEVFDVLDEEA